MGTPLWPPKILGNNSCSGDGQSPNPERRSWSQTSIRREGRERCNGKVYENIRDRKTIENRDANFGVRRGKAEGWFRTKYEQSTSSNLRVSTYCGIKESGVFSRRQGTGATGVGVGHDQKISCGRMRRCATRCGGRAFTLIDVLVSISIIAVLIAILLPSLSKVNETARRTVCQSNIRQIGLGVIMYADDYNGYLPYSRFVSSSNMGLADEDGKALMDTVRISSQQTPGVPWDGLGLLFALDYINAPKVFYCPSHHGDNPYSAYALAWASDSHDEIVCNYHYRGEGPAGRVPLPDGRVRQTSRLYLIDPDFSSLIADGLRTQADYNHRVGVNFFRADLTVHWFDDRGRRLLSMLPVSPEDVDSAPVERAWLMFDGGVVEPPE
jgi:type II secretory pathway pseudopilin PulG